MTKPTTWFIAHATPDKELARRLGAALESSGVSKWMATEDLQPACDWTEEIKAAQAACAGTLVLWSEHGEGAHYLRSEVTAAVKHYREGGHRLQVVRVDDFEAMYGLENMQALDLRVLDCSGVAAELGILEGAKSGLVEGAGARVVVVGLQEELGEAVEAVKTAVGRQPGVAEVEVVDVGAVGARARVEGAELRIVVLGYGTAGKGGLGVFEAALAEPGRVIGLHREGDRGALKRYKSDRDHAQDLWECCPLEFDDKDGVAAVLAPAIEAWIRAHTGSRAGLAPGERAWLVERLPSWELGKGAAVLDQAGAQKCTFRRDSLYVSMSAEGWVRLRSGEVLPATDKRARAAMKALQELRNEGTRGGPARDRPQPAEAALLDEVFSITPTPLLVLGEAGMGKSVFLEHLATSLARIGLGGGAPPASGLLLDLLSGGPALDAPIPVLVQAEDLARVLEATRGSGAIPAWLAGLLDLPAEAVEEGLEAGRYALLVDSLDEVPEAPSDQPSRRTALQTGLLGFAGRFPACRVVLSSRPHAPGSAGAGWTTVVISPLDEAQRNQLVDNWIAAQNLGGEDSDKLRAAVAGLDLPEDRDGRDPRSNALLLTCVLMVWQVNRSLPEDLAQLYDDMVEILMKRRQGEDSDAVRREALERIAWRMQETGEQRTPWGELGQVLVDASLAKGLREAARLLDQLHQTSAILRKETTNNGLVGRMWHRSFQEFLAASHLARRPGDDAAKVRELFAQGRLLSEDWRGCVRLLVGAFGNVSLARAVTAVEAMAGLAREHEGQEGALWGIAVAGIAEHRTRCFRRHPVGEAIPEGAARAFEARGLGWSVAECMGVTDALGALPVDPRLADPRETVQDWVPFGPWRGTVGSDKQAYQTLDPTEVEVDRLWVRRWPVTVREYGAFLADGEADNSELFDRTGEPGRRPPDWASQERHGSRPVTTVTWWQARAFCRWAQTRWRLPEGGVLVELPSSAEREAIALGDRRAGFPWGDGPVKEERGVRARGGWGWREAGVRHGSSAAGAFPLGQVDREVWDLAGNVWEWTGSEWGNDLEPMSIVDMAPPAAGLRVLRGGSWFGHDPRALRCATRLRDAPSSRGGAVGFRLVCRVSPSRPA